MCGCVCVCVPVMLKDAHLLQLSHWMTFGKIRVVPRCYGIHGTYKDLSIYHILSMYSACSKESLTFPFEHGKFRSEFRVFGRKSMQIKISHLGHGIWEIPGRDETRRDEPSRDGQPVTDAKVARPSATRDGTTCIWDEHDWALLTARTLDTTIVCDACQ